jgi:hypothetical protein
MNYKVHTCNHGSRDSKEVTTKAEIEADKAAATEAKEQQEDKVKATNQWMAQMNMDEDEEWLLGLSGDSLVFKS